MGDMADFALDNAWDQVEHFSRHEHSSLAEQYDEGLIDEQGCIIGQPWGTPTAKRPRRSYAEATPWEPAPRGPHGAGECPECSGATQLRTGPYGAFYGCMGFPKCKGSRSK